MMFWPNFGFFLISFNLNESFMKLWQVCPIIESLPSGLLFFVHFTSICKLFILHVSMHL